MSDDRLPPSASEGTGWSARLMRAAVLGTVRSTLMVTRSRRTWSGPLPAAPSVVAFHHTSPVDAFLIGLPTWKARHAPIAMVKSSVFRHALSGPVVRIAGMIPVSRQMQESRSEATDASLAHLRAGHVVHIAPGGTLDPLHVLPPWRAGAARIAQAAAVPLVPAVVIGPERWGGQGGKPFKFVPGTPVHVAFGDPVLLGPDDDPIAAIDRARGSVASLIELHTGRPVDLLDQ